MIKGIIDIANIAWQFLLEMSPYLLLGFFVAGILNIIIPRDKIYKHLSGSIVLFACFRIY